MYNGSVPLVLLILVPLFGRARARWLVRVNYAIGIKVGGIEPVKLAVMRCSRRAQTDRTSAVNTCKGESSDGVSASQDYL